MNPRFISQAVLGVLALSVISAGAAGYIWGLPALLLVFAGGALSLVIVLMWASLQQMEESDEMEFEQALSYAAPSIEEEQKRALLRTLKDLEYELSVGKISREDYDQIYAEVAEKAKRMIALTDDAMKARIAAAEARVSSRLDSLSLPPSPEPSSNAEPASVAPGKVAPGKEELGDEANRQEENKTEHGDTATEGGNSKTEDGDKKEDEVRS